MNKEEYFEVKRKLEALNVGYGESQKNILSHNRWVLIIETSNYYHAEARLKKDITLVLQRAMGGIYFRAAKIKAPGENKFKSYQETFGAIPEIQSEASLDIEAAANLREARAEAGWVASDYARGYKDPIIEEPGVGGIKIPKGGSIGALVLLMGILAVLWYLLFTNIRRG